MSEETAERLIKIAAAILDEVRAVRADLDERAKKREARKQKKYAAAIERERIRQTTGYKDKPPEEFSN